MNTFRRLIRRVLPCALLGLITPATSGHADVFISNAFAGPDGPLASISGWQETKPTAGEVTTSERNLLVKNGELVWEGTPGIVNTSVRRMLMPWNGVIPETIFVGFVLNVETPPVKETSAGTSYVGKSFFAFSNASSSVMRAHLGVVYGSVPGSYRISLGHSARSARADVLPAEFQAGENVRIVVAYNTVTRTATLWINPSGRADEPGLLTTPEGNAAAINALTLRMLNYGKEDMGTLRISRLVAATTFAEAMPPL